MREHKKPHAKTLFKFAGQQVMCHFHGVRTLNFLPGMWIAKLLMSLPPSVVSRIFLIINFTRPNFIYFGSIISLDQILFEPRIKILISNFYLNLCSNSLSYIMLPKNKRK